MTVDTVNLPAVRETPSPEALNALVTTGNLNLLTPDQKRGYYIQLCRSLGLNPMTRPFQFIELNGKLVPYAAKDATDQLRRLYKVSLRIVDRSKDISGDTYDVQVEAKTYDGRVDFATGSVSLFKEDKTGIVKKEGKPVRLQGSEIANAIMKAETKAKRRATLSICGLGMMDESEMETVRGAKPVTWDTVMGETSGVRISVAQAREIRELAGEKGVFPDQLSILLGDKSPEDLTEDQFAIAKKMLELRVSPAAE
jgi:hypothetical protein